MRRTVSRTLCVIAGAIVLAGAVAGARHTKAGWDDYITVAYRP